MKRLLAALAAAAAVAGPAIVAPAQAEVQRDWSQAVVATPEGGFRMGNPAAPLKVVEFVSLTCPHCRSFAEAGAPALVRGYVRTGQASFEIRPFPLDIIAAVGAQLNRCAAPDRAFAFNDDILATQDQWFAQLDALSERQVEEIEALPPGDQRRRIAQAVGFDAVAARHGVGTAELSACLGDQAGADRIDAIKAAAEQIGVQGTPSFTINGRLAHNVHDWASLEPLLRGR